MTRCWQSYRSRRSGTRNSPRTSPVRRLSRSCMDDARRQRQTSFCRTRDSGLTRGFAPYSRTWSTSGITVKTPSAFALHQSPSGNRRFALGRVEWCGTSPLNAMGTAACRSTSDCPSKRTSTCPSSRSTSEATLTNG
eukprot:257729-Pleurochrysis_carterae.AAC.1